MRVSRWPSFIYITYLVKKISHGVCGRSQRLRCLTKTRSASSHPRPTLRRGFDVASFVQNLWLARRRSQRRRSAVPGCIIAFSFFLSLSHSLPLSRARVPSLFPSFSTRSGSTLRYRGHVHDTATGPRYVPTDRDLRPYVVTTIADAELRATHYLVSELQ